VSLSPGDRLGSFEIVGQLGAGGMGEVWRARDGRLKRDVAIKVLPAAFVEDAERLARFEREAQLLAQLNHPNIAQIYGLEAIGETHALVMELVEGPTLADRLDGGALPVAESLAIARQIAEALEEAHDKGIVHRDLKPANVKAPAEGKVKVLDFGLAKAYGAASLAEVSPSHLAHSPTLTLGGTREGVILGTAAYMAPEQARGLAVDKRADIWAFGVVLFEMLSGAPLFASDSVPDTLARVLQREVDFEALPTSTPPAIRRLLRRCLERQPKNRLHDIADARLVIEDALAGRDAAAVAPVGRSPARQPLLLLPWALLVVAVGGLLALYPRLFHQVAPLRGQFEISLPEGRRLDALYRRAIAISPDGGTIAVITSDAKKPPADVASPSRRIELRSLDDSVFRPVAGTEGAVELAFSPDGAWIAYTLVPTFSPSTATEEPYSELRKVPIQGGRPVTLCRNRGGWGLAWSEDGWIAFGGPDGAILKVRAEGSAVEPLTRIAESDASIWDVLPTALPEGRAWLYSSVAAKSFHGLGRHQLRLRRSGETGSTEILESAADVRFVPPEHLLFASEGRLLDIRFSERSGKVSGEARTLIDGVAQALNTTSGGLETAQAQYDVSGNGVLVYAPGGVVPPRSRVVEWIDATGRSTEIDLEPSPFLSERISPDGQSLLFSMVYSGRQVELYDSRRGIRRRVVSHGTSTWAIWGPKADQFTFASDHEGPISLFVGSVNGAVDAVTRLFENPPGQEIIGPSSWSPDGNRLLYVVEGERSTGDVWLFERGRSPQPYLATRFDEQFPEFSPDGRWVAYMSNQTGQPAVWARPFSNVEGAVQVSPGLAAEPAWSRDGGFIYFKSLEPDPGSSGQRVVFLRVRVTFRGDRLAMGKPERLFAGNLDGASPIRSYDLAGDGRILASRDREIDETEKERRKDALFPRKLIVILGHLPNRS